MTAPRTVLCVYGTRPEAVKLAPVVTILRDHPLLRGVVAVTAQHRAMLDQVHALFGVVPDVDLDLFVPGQPPTVLAARALLGLTDVLHTVRPDAVLVQGDTTTSTAAALAAAYQQVPVVHLEAGLRTHRRHSPFPEEINRRLTAQLASLHLAPTASARDNLLREGVEPGDVVVTGNTVIDALLGVVGRRQGFVDPRLRILEGTGRPVLLLTVHRRESWGEPLAAVARAVAEAARRHPELLVVAPLHANPVVRDAVLPALAGVADVVVTDPLDYADFVGVMALSHLVVTDSGGVQEEAPSLGRPVLVVRDDTERPEAIAAGTARLVGTDESRVLREVLRLLEDPVAYRTMSRATNPYGDGRAAERSVAAVASLLGVGTRLPGFVP